MYLCLRLWGTPCLIHRKCSKKKSVALKKNHFIVVAETHKSLDVSFDAPVW